MTRTHRRTRRHPDKWKQRARMRQIVQQWNDEKLIQSFSLFDFSAFGRAMRLWSDSLAQTINGIAAVFNTPEIQALIASKHSLGELLATKRE